MPSPRLFRFDAANHWKRECLAEFGFMVEATLKKQLRGLDVQVLSRA